MHPWCTRTSRRSGRFAACPSPPRSSSGRYNIRINSLHPGFIRTPMTKHFPDDMVTSPLGRPGKSEEVSTFVVFLASDESSFSTGAEFVVDGGLVTDVPHKDLF